MKRETSGKSTRAILLYLTKHGREEALSAIPGRFGVPLDDLLDEYNWFSYQLKIDLLRYGIEVTGDPLMPMSMGREIVALDTSRAELLLARALLSPENTFRRVAQSVGHFTAVAEMECREAQDGRALVAYRVTSDVRPEVEDCLYTQGVMSGIPDIFHRGPARVRHPECQVKGAPWCLFEVTYPAARHAPFRARREARQWLEEAVRELEGKHRLLEDKQFRLQELTNELRAQVAERTRDLHAANERLTEMNAFKDHLLMALSHDLRSPLAVIQGLSEVGGSPGVDGARALGFIQRSAEQALFIVEDLLDYTQITTGNRTFHGELAELGPIVENVVQAQTFEARTLSVGIVPLLEPRLPAIWLDRRKIVRAVTNLVANAVKFSPAGTTVEVRVGASGERQLVEVIDRGPGVLDDERDRIFEPFFRGRTEARVAGASAGLGLAMVRQIMEAHDGMASAGRTPDGRTCFTLSIPVRAAPAAPPG